MGTSLPRNVNERLLVLLNINPGVMGLGSDSVGQLLLKADEEGGHPLHWLRSCHESKISLWQLGLEFLQNTNSLWHLNFTNRSRLCLKTMFLFQIFNFVIGFEVVPERLKFSLFVRPSSTASHICEASLFNWGCLLQNSHESRGLKSQDKIIEITDWSQLCKNKDRALS